LDNENDQDNILDGLYLPNQNLFSNDDIDSIKQELQI